MWILDSFSSLGFNFRFAITGYPIRFCLGRELDAVVRRDLKNTTLDHSDSSAEKKPSSSAGSGVVNALTGMLGIKRKSNASEKERPRNLDVFETSSPPGDHDDKKQQQMQQQLLQSVNNGESPGVNNGTQPNLPLGLRSRPAGV